MLVHNFLLLQNQLEIYASKMVIFEESLQVYFEKDVVLQFHTLAQSYKYHSFEWHCFSAIAFFVMSIEYKISSQLKSRACNSLTS